MGFVIGISVFQVIVIMFLAPFLFLYFFFTDPQRTQEEFWRKERERVDKRAEEKVNDFYTMSDEEYTKKWYLKDWQIIYGKRSGNQKTGKSFTEKTSPSSQE